jgi:hypothetical protein
LMVIITGGIILILILRKKKWKFNQLNILNEIL